MTMKKMMVILFDMSKILKNKFRQQLASIMIDPEQRKWYKINPGNINVTYEDGKFHFNITLLFEMEKYKPTVHASIKTLTQEQAEKLYIKSTKKS